MKIGDKISSLSKQKGLNRDELDKIVGAFGAVIGGTKGTRLHHRLSLQKKMADALEVTFDFLTGSTKFVIQDKKMLYSLELLQKITQTERNTISNGFFTT